MKKIGLALITAFALSSPLAMAVPFTETPDAGSLVGSAQDVAGTNITSISGSTSANDGDYEDLFSFYWGGGLFEAATDSRFGPTTTNFDTMLFLFDGAGTFIAADDDAGAGLTSYISETLAAGDYLLGISGYANEAENGTPTGFLFEGGSGTLAGWEEGGGTGAYTIGIGGRGIDGTVPEPAPLALLALGLTAFGLARRKRK